MVPEPDDFQYLELIAEVHFRGVSVESCLFYQAKLAEAVRASAVAEARRVELLRSLTGSSTFDDLRGLVDASRAVLSDSDSAEIAHRREVVRREVERLVKI